MSRIWALHLLCFVLPLTCTLFLASAPHAAWGALSWLLVIVVSIALDMRSPTERRQPLPTLPGWPFNGVLYALAVRQLVNVALLVRMAAFQGVWTTDALVGVILVGVGSGYLGFVVAHELIHRSSPRLQALGPPVLCTVF